MENNERPQLTADLEGNYLIDKESAGEKPSAFFMPLRAAAYTK